MQKVITINLNGNAYQLDEAAYHLLRVYLDGAELQLRDNPDKAEIISDLEQAIADKCARVLSPHKTVVTTAEVQRILDEMGPVDGAAGESAGEPAAGGGAHERARAETGAPKRLYQVDDGAMLSGVCKGIAAYLNVDVTIVRIVFVLLAVLTKGVWVGVYLLLMVVVPRATTSEERAAAYGQRFNAQELIDEAKRNYATFKNSRQWKRQWRRQQREWRRRVRPMTGGLWGPPPAQPVGYAAQIGAGIILPLLTIASTAVFWLWLCAMASLFGTNAIFGWPIPEDVPVWAAVLVGLLAYSTVTWPLHAARRASYYALGTHAAWVTASDGLFGAGVSLLCLWVAWHYVPEVHDFVDHMPVVRENIQNLFRGF